MINTYLYIGFSSLGIVVVNLIWWIYLSITFGSFNVVKQKYLSHFPEEIRNAIILTLISISLLGIAIFCFYKAYNLSQNKIKKKITKASLIISCLLLAWHIFSLM